MRKDVLSHEERCGEMCKNSEIIIIVLVSLPRLILTPTKSFVSIPSEEQTLSTSTNAAIAIAIVFFFQTMHMLPTGYKYS